MIQMDETMMIGTMVFSDVADRLNPLQLADSVVEGVIYPFFETTFTNITQVRFYVDGSLKQTENNAPYDLGGTESGLAGEFDTSTLREGNHTLSLEIDIDGGANKGGQTETISLDFFVDNIADAPGVVISDANVLEGVDDYIIFDVVLSRAASEDIILDLVAVDSSAINGLDYVSQPFEVSYDGGNTWQPGDGSQDTEVTFLAQQTSLQVRFALIDDNIPENLLETMSLEVASVVSGTVSDFSDTGTGTIEDNDIVKAVISDATAFEGTDSHLIFDIDLTNPSPNTITLALDAIDVSAQGGTLADFNNAAEFVDYANQEFEVSIDGGLTWQDATNGNEVTFDIGQTALKVRAAVNEDDIREGPTAETLNLVIGSVLVGSLTDASDIGLGSIFDNDYIASQVHLAWVDDPSTTLTVVWHTQSLAEPSTIEYRVAGETQWQTATGAFRPSGTPVGTLHEVNLTDLNPGTVYEYRIPGDDPVYTTQTAPSAGNGDYSVIYVADTGLIGREDGLATGTEQVIQEIDALNPLLILGGGDYAYFNTDKRFSPLDSAIDEWFRQWEPVLSESPILPTYGNHELQLEEEYQPWADRFPTPEGYKNRRFYSFDIGDAHFISILSEEEIGTNWLSVDDLDWIEQDILDAQQRGQRWIIPYMHEGPYGEGSNHPSTDEIRNKLAPLFERLNVDLVVYSHDQSYERTYPLTDTFTPTSTSLTDYTKQDGVIYVKTSPGGKISNINGSFSDFPSETPPDYMAFRDNTMHHFTQLTILDEGIIRVDTYGVVGDGTPPVIIDSFEISDGLFVNISDATATEGINDFLIFDLTLSQVSNETISLALSTTDDTANGGSVAEFDNDLTINPVDYGNQGFEVSYDGGTTWQLATNSNEVTFSVGQTALKVRLSVNDDLAAENAETFNLQIANVVTGTVLDAFDIGIGEIIDNDSVQPIDVTVSDATATEGIDDYLLFNVGLTQESSETVILDLAATDGTATSGLDYLSNNFEFSLDGGTSWQGAGGVNGTELSFDVGQTDLIVRIAVIDDQDIEGFTPESMTLEVASVIAGIVSNFADTGTGFITDNDSNGKSYSLYDATTDTLLGQIEDGGEIIIGSEVDLNELSIVANYEDELMVESVRLELNGQGRTENTAPYALFGDNSGDFDGDSIPIGLNTLDVFAYSQNNAQGDLLASDSIQFTLSVDDSNSDELSVTISDATATEGIDDYLLFNVGLTQESSETVILDLAATDGTATSGLDYLSNNFEFSLDGGTSWQGAGGVNGTELSFDAGQTDLIVRIAVIDDQDIEGFTPESMTLEVASVIAGTVSNFADTGTGFITDNDSSGNSYSLYDATTDTLLGQIEDRGEIIIGSEVDLNELSIVANYEDELMVESVRLELNGQGRTENTAPYALFGDNSGDFDGGSIPIGLNTLDVFAYSQNNAQGDLLASDSIQFTLSV